MLECREPCSRDFDIAAFGIPAFIERARWRAQNGMSSSPSPPPPIGSKPPPPPLVPPDGTRAAGAVIVVVLATGAAATTPRAATAATEQLDPVGHDLGGVPLLAVLVVPGPRLDAALDVDLLALLQVVLQRLGLLAEQDDAVPLGLLDPVAGLAVLATIGGRDAETRDREAVAGELQFRIPPEVADENRLVDAAHTLTALSPPGRPGSLTPRRPRRGAPDA